MNTMNHLNAAIGYIEKRLFDVIDFTEMARLAACTEYQFRRMFSYLAQMPLNEYIRRRRLTMAAKLLHPGKGRIIDISHQCGYDSPDAFNKAFAAQFGITPFAYRRNPVPLLPFPPLRFQLTVLQGFAENALPVNITRQPLREGGNNTMAKLSSFTPEEKEACLPIIELMIDGANVARAQGVLALEEWAKEKNPFLTFMMNLVVDGTDPALVHDIGSTLIDADDHTGVALLSRKMMLEGVLSIQAGENPRIIETKLLAMLGERFLLAHGSITDTAPPDDLSYNELTALLRDNKSDAIYTEFNTTFAPLTDRDIQNVLREIAQKDFTIALKGADGGLAERFMSNLSKRLATMIMEEMEHMGPVREEDILAAQERMLAVLRRMQDTGDIAPPDAAIKPDDSVLSKA